MAKNHRSRILEIDLNQPAAFDEEENAGVNIAVAEVVASVVNSSQVSMPAAFDEEENAGINIAATEVVASVVNSGQVSMVRDEIHSNHQHHGGISENPPRMRRTPRKDVRADECSKPNHGDQKESTYGEENPDKEARPSVGNGLPPLAIVDEITRAGIGNAPGKVKGSEMAAPPVEVLAAADESAVVAAGGSALPGVELTRSVRLTELENGDRSQPPMPPVDDEDEGSSPAAAAAGAVATPAVLVSGHIDLVWENPPRKRRTPREDVWAVESSKANHGSNSGAEGGGGKMAHSVALDRKESTGTEENSPNSPRATVFSISNPTIPIFTGASSTTWA
ncbi:OLC1v1031625C1 [Oldenlandia corymbosa var. corymbosa]|uniref:OLC1v1031625C1 n=1 Tax=Oldenlandia corymbosa var. corymbosa TaxID=529605 RepID=A0AAV1CJ07_OLDCO|nr:OLC1v1031625C1 [Oldenlandia corymbosa var. corymbosa]